MGGRGGGLGGVRLWSERKPEFVKADKHFVTGLARDPVKVQFLRAIQHIAESSGSLVIAEGIESAADFKVVKDIGVACGQGWFIGRPAEIPSAKLPEEAQRANTDAKLPVVPAPRLRAGTEPSALDFVRAVEPAAAHTPVSDLLVRFATSPALAAIPIMGASGIEGVVSRSLLDLVAASGASERLGSRPCIEFADRAPIHVEPDLDLAALTALLVESDARRPADGFVIASHGRYLGVGTSSDVMRSLQSSRVLAARYTNPLTLLPGQVPINEHLERLLAGHVPFTAWFIEINQMRGLNDSQGFSAGDALIHATARLVESVCEHGVHFPGPFTGSRFVLLVQSEDWQARPPRPRARLPPGVEAHAPATEHERGYFTLKRRGGPEDGPPLPKPGIRL